MTTAPPQELLMQWSQETLTTDRATGQILQHLVAMQATLDVLQRRLSALQSQVEQMTPATSRAPELPQRRKASQRQ